MSGALYPRPEPRADHAFRLTIGMKNCRGGTSPHAAGCSLPRLRQQFPGQQRGRQVDSPPAHGFGWYSSITAA